MKDQTFVPISTAAKMWGEPRARVKQWAQRSRSGEMQKHAIPKGAIRIEPVSGHWEVSLEGMKAKLGTDPVWVPEHLAAEVQALKGHDAT